MLKTLNNIFYKEYKECPIVITNDNYIMDWHSAILHGWSTSKTVRAHACGIQFKLQSLGKNE